MIHYHGTPINPKALLYQLAGRHFCVSFYDPRQVKAAHDIGQSVLLDNGAFTAWRTGLAPDWTSYYAWADPWLDHPTTWAIIPDQIDGPVEAQDALLASWPFGAKGAPVWHMAEPISRLLALLDSWPRVCMGSSGACRIVLSEAWCRRADEAWNAIAKRGGRTPWIHLLRGMQCAGERWPFASVDSTDIARNHNRLHNSPVKLAQRWDGVQAPGRWSARPEQIEITL